MNKKDLKYYAKKIIHHNTYSENRKLIGDSEYFDGEWYKKTYLSDSGVDPIEHYLKEGITGKYDPSLNFSSQAYLDLYNDVRMLGVNPLLHYEKFGKEEGRTVEESRIKTMSDSVFFDTKWYADKYTGGDTSKALDHYLAVGGKEGYQTSPFFDKKFYIENKSFTPAETIHEFSENQTSEKSIVDAPLYDFWINGKNSGKYFSDYKTLAEYYSKSRKQQPKICDNADNYEDINIFVACNAESYVPKNKIFKPIQTGSAVANKRFENFIQDDEGENISERNPSYCELTAQYWAWKNTDTDYIGFFHNRRYLSFSKDKFQTDNNGLIKIGAVDDDAVEKFGFDDYAMADVIRNYDILVPESVDLSKIPQLKPATVYQQMLDDPGLSCRDMDCALDYLKQHFVDYCEDIDTYMNGRYGYFLNMYIMKREIFNDYCNWLFPILDHVYANTDRKNYNNFQMRMVGMVSERLFGIYYTHLKRTTNFKTKELQCVLFSTLENPNYEPAFKDNNIALAFCTCDLYAPLLGVAIKSVVENSNSKYNYDIIILHNSLNEMNLIRLSEIVSGHDNFKIRFRNIGSVFASANISGCMHISNLTYGRLMLPSILKEYKKVLYIDCDLIVNSDVAELFNIDLGDKLIAAVKDVNVAGWSKIKSTHQCQYNNKILNMEDTFAYFNAGISLMNLEEFRKIYTWNDMIEIISSQNWRWMDQDILNAMCYGRVLDLDMKWNVTVCVYQSINQIPVYYAPKEIYLAYMNALKNPAIIHFAGHHTPCFEPAVVYAEKYWEYAKATPYYEQLLKMR